MSHHRVLHRGGHAKPLPNSSAAHRRISRPRRRPVRGRPARRAASSRAAAQCGDHGVTAVRPVRAARAPDGADRPAIPRNFTANTRLQSRHLQAPCESSCGHRFVSPQYGQYCAGARFSLMGRRRAAHSSASSSARGDPLGEPLAVLALRLEGLEHPLDVVGQFVGGDLVAADLAAEPGVQAEPAAQVHLEALDLLAAVVGDDHALETDVGDLGAGAGVRAAVDVDGERHVEVADAAAPVRRPARCRAPWSRRSPACRTRGRCRPSCSAGTSTA